MNNLVSFASLTAACLSIGAAAYAHDETSIIWLCGAVIWACVFLVSIS